MSAAAASACCTACRPVLGRLARRHAPEACPLLKGSYCGMCASYGHSPATCPDRITRSFRQPQFIEQLMPSTLLEQYGITTCTPLPALVGAPVPLPPAILEIPETDEALRAAVLAAGGKPMICQERGRVEKKELAENKKRLQKLADAKGQRIVFVAAAEVAVVAPVPAPAPVSTPAPTPKK
jgi:hypothetical protein